MLGIENKTGIHCANPLWRRRLPVQQMKKVGCNRLVARFDFDSSLEDAVRCLATDSRLRRRMSAEGQRRVDGRGAERVADEIARVRSALAAAQDAR